MDLRPILKIDRALSGKLCAGWRPAADAVWADVEDCLRSKDYGGAYQAAATLSLKSAAEKNREYIKYYLLGAGLFGARIANKSRATALSTGTYETFLSKVADQVTRSVEYNCTEAAYDRLVQLIAAAEREETPHQQSDSELVQKADRFVKGFVSFKQGGDERIQLVSSLNTHRLATWGFMAEMDVLAEDTYRLSAVLDGRTSEFCIMIDGTEFQVSDGKDRIVKALSAEDPEDLKTIQPWPKKDRKSITTYKAMSTEELAACGYDVPPFHPGCRTMCVRTDTQSEQELVQVPPEYSVQQQSTEASFEAVGAKMSAEDLAAWNEGVAKSPADVLSRLTGDTPDQLLEKPYGDQKFFSFDANDNLKMRVVGDLAGAGTEEEVHFVLDPLTKTLFSSWAEYTASPERAAEWLRGLYKRAADMGLMLGATEMVVLASGAYSAYAYAKMGFVPESSDEWLTLQYDIEDDLKDGGKLHELLPEKGPELAVLGGLLDHHDPQAIWTIAALPYGEKLLEGRSLKMRYPFGSPDAKAMFEEALS